MHLATEKKKIAFRHSLKINKRGTDPHKLQGVRKKIEKLISVPPFIKHLRVTSKLAIPSLFLSLVFLLLVLPSNFFVSGIKNSR